MTDLEIIERPPVRHELEIENALRKQLLDQIKEESQVIVHCSFKATYPYSQIRIWKSTFLYPRDAETRSALIHCENISLYPDWMPVEYGQTLIFTLVFSGLPKECKSFDLMEKIPEPGGFEIRNIRRNSTDVYHVDIE
ncbi:MAG: hypothetical protein ACK53R_10200 [Bacteroidota bacterium]|jgi:hypothetical protein